MFHTKKQNFRTHKHWNILMANLSFGLVGLFLFLPGCGWHCDIRPFLIFFFFLLFISRCWIFFFFSSLQRLKIFAISSMFGLIAWFHQIHCINIYLCSEMINRIVRHGVEWWWFHVSLIRFLLFSLRCVICAVRWSSFVAVFIAVLLLFCVVYVFVTFFFLVLENFWFYLFLNFAVNLTTFDIFICRTKTCKITLNERSAQWIPRCIWEYKILAFGWNASEFSFRHRRTFLQLTCALNAIAWFCRCATRYIDRVDITEEQQQNVQDILIEFLSNWECDSKSKQRNKPKYHHHHSELLIETKKIRKINWFDCRPGIWFQNCQSHCSVSACNVIVKGKMRPSVIVEPEIETQILTISIFNEIVFGTQPNGKL